MKQSVFIVVTITVLISLANAVTTGETTNTHVVWDSANSYSRAAANSYCSSTYGTELATVTASEYADIIATKVSSMGHAGCPWVWIGLTDPSASGTWAWENGQSYADDLSWYRPESSTATATETGAILELCNEGLGRRNPSDAFNWFVCNKPSITTGETTNTYVVWDSVKSFTRAAANSYCSSTYGTELATVTAAEYADIVTTKVAMGQAGCPWSWIGLTDPSASGTWAWENGQSYVDDLPWYRPEQSTATTTETGAILELCGSEGLGRRNPSDAFQWFVCNKPIDGYFKFYISSISGSQTVADVQIQVQLYGRVYTCTRGPLNKGTSYSCPFDGEGTTITYTSDTVNKITFTNDHPDAPYIYRVKVVDAVNAISWDIYTSFCLAIEHHWYVGWYGTGHSRMNNPCECDDGGVASFDSGAFLVDNDFSFPVVSVILDETCLHEGRVEVSSMPAGGGGSEGGAIPDWPMPPKKKSYSYPPPVMHAPVPEPEQPYDMTYILTAVIFALVLVNSGLIVYNCRQNRKTVQYEAVSYDSQSDTRQVLDR